MNISGEIYLAEVANQACCSSHQFQRMFSFITDVSLAEYIRHAIDLLNSDAKMIDIALKYGYDSTISFARAFQSMHGVRGVYSFTRFLEISESRNTAG
nr:helix-turn-helix domain-containing protein [Paenibacillus plantarum]